MKARVKATGEIVEVSMECNNSTDFRKAIFRTKDCMSYRYDDVELIFDKIEALKMEDCKCKVKSLAERIIEYKEFVSIVMRMREKQRQWRDGDPFDCTEIELAKKMCEAEREVDEYLKKMEE